MSVFTNVAMRSHGGRKAMAGRAETRTKVSARESLRFLTEVGNALAASLDYEVTLQRVAELTVPRLACYCELDLIEDGRVKRVGFAGGDAARQDESSGTPLFSERLDTGGPLAEVLRTRESLLIIHDQTPGSSVTGRRRRQVELLRQAAATSILLTPLIARDRVLGVLLLASSRDDRFYDSRDAVLADELARIAALAIDNARLYSEANQAIHAREEMLRVVSHDLRNPIGAMSLAAAHVLEEAGDSGDGPRDRMLRTIVRASRQANRLIDDLMDLSRIESGKLLVDLLPESLAPILMEAVELHGPTARLRGIDIHCEAQGPLPMALVDHARLLQLLGNLLSNAIRFTPPEGRIELAARACGDAICCSVSDTGPGIPQPLLPHVFDRYWQATRGDRAGIGLGLAIVKGIAEAHGGTVTVDSEPGRGTSFHFTLVRAGIDGDARAREAEVDRHDRWAPRRIGGEERVVE